MPSRFLIINGDDLGFARSINDAIVQCANRGVLRSATLMANGRAFDHAVESLRAAGNLKVGIHMVLTDLHPLGGPGDVGGLVGEDGRLPRGPWGLLASMVRGRVSGEDLRRELSLQVEKLLDHGIRPTHLDSHKHVHVFPPVLNAVVHVAQRYGIPWIRNPFDDSGGLVGMLQCVAGNLRPRFLQQTIQSRLARIFQVYFLHSVRRAGLRTPRHFYGTALTGLWSLESARRAFHQLPAGISEWMVHPGNADEELKASGTRLVQERENEKNLLLSPELRRFLDERSIGLGSFGDDLP